MRLSERTLETVPREIMCSHYDREAQAAGIVHLGIGAFHRAHQAWYTDLAMGLGDVNWGIVGVSLRSPSVARQLNPQDGLYSLTECSAQGRRMRVIGSVQRVLVAAQDCEEVVAAIAGHQTKIVSLTITEKGYCRGPDGALQPLQAHEGTIYPLLAAGLRERREMGLPGLTLLSCDNLADNGAQLERLTAEYLSAHDPALADWVKASCTFPSTMVDRIVPATTAADRETVATTIGLEDHGAVVTEPFSQWIIEDRFAAGRPSWDRVGATFVSDVAPYETAKLRMLNGAHSAVAYLGLERDYDYVHEAIGDPAIKALIERMMRVEALPTIKAAPGQDLEAYADELLLRFANPALNHRLVQIASDGSQKIPQRWLETLAANQETHRECPAILAALAAWLRHVSGRLGPVDDPLASQMRDAWDAFGSTGMCDAILGDGGVVRSDWRPTLSDRITIGAMLEQ